MKNLKNTVKKMNFLDCLGESFSLSLFAGYFIYRKEKSVIGIVHHKGNVFAFTEYVSSFEMKKDFENNVVGILGLDKYQKFSREDTMYVKHLCKHSEEEILYKFKISSFNDYVQFLEKSHREKDFLYVSNAYFNKRKVDIAPFCKTKYIYREEKSFTAKDLFLMKNKIFKGNAPKAMYNISIARKEKKETLEKKKMCDACKGEGYI